ncbi:MULTISPECIES: hypothetical protein [unclassified Acidovorax]|uniref:hypothetical protein n=1 Tax=unclassified Acidovorax TaxID=2684926 RepID=UPI000A73CEC0|nr:MULTISPECIES: hypothetical protein [unclassified Acidovorax]
MPTTTFAHRMSASLALAFALTAPAAVTAAESAATAAPASQPNPYPAIDPAFSKPDDRRMPSRTTLRSFLSEMKSHRQSNTFCFVQRRLDAPDTAEPGLSVLSMIWNEGKSIHLVNLLGPGERFERDDALDEVAEGRSMAHGTGTVDLTTSVVPTDEDVGGSTFLVSRPWVDHMFTQCRRVGTRVRIPAFRPTVPRHTS